MYMTDLMNENLKMVKPSGIRQFARIAAEKKGCIGLTIGEPDFNTPDIIKEQAKKALDENMTHYPENTGYRFLREAISAFERNKNGLNYDPDEIIFTLGATEALFASIFAIIEKGDEIMVPVPAFGLYESIINMCGGTCINMNTCPTDFQITKDLLEQHFSPRTKALILTSPGNPTGCIYTEETLSVIHDFAAEKNIFVICDDVYRQLVYTDNYQSFASFTDLRDRIIVIQSYSKPYAMTGWRGGYLMADAPVKQVIERAHQYMVVSAPSLIQTACKQALEFSPSEMVETYRKRRDYVYNRLVNMGLHVNKPEGAFYIFPSIEKFGVSSEEFCLDMIDKVLLALTPGIFFNGEGYVRISYCYGDDVLHEGMNRLEKYIKLLG